MSDYGEMQQALREIDEQLGTLSGLPCPRAPCFGTLRREGGTLVCEYCATLADRTRDSWRG